jgi:hypothetical protein
VITMLSCELTLMTVLDISPTRHGPNSISLGGFTKANVSGLCTLALIVMTCVMHCVVILQCVQ